MCGIAGFFNVSGKVPHAASMTILKAMGSVQLHRGPTENGTWLDSETGIALAHQRLSIRDLSPAGRQPMESHNGRYIIIYNGEIYNNNEIRRDIESALGHPHPWKGHSDTEILLEACSVFGVHQALQKTLGEFAFALWDRKEHTLVLARDRFGIKPLYWGIFDQDLVFGSELKALAQHPGFRPELNKDAIAAYTHYCCIPAPHSIYKGVYKLSPGCYLTCAVGNHPTVTPYWDPLQVALDGISNSFTDETEATETLHELLRDAIRRCSVSDVPVGAFLSGGIDSSLVSALMQEASTHPIHTFSIGFHEAAFNEAPFAKQVAQHLGTQHTEMYVTTAEAQEMIPRLPHMYDEPFADSSQIPTALVSQLARNHVTVVLSGDGGDEFFAGYPRYYHPIDGRGDVYRLTHMTHWHDTDALVPGSSLPPHPFADKKLHELFTDDRKLKQYLDTIHYLPNDILVKVDRAAMFFSLEARPPLLDHRVFALAWRFPSAMLERNGAGKWPLRQILKQYIPETLFERPKMGFGVPIDHWLRGNLRDWAESLLSEKKLKESGIFNPVMVRGLWDKHLAGENWQYWLWDILMFEAWKEAQPTSLNVTH